MKIIKHIFCKGCKFMLIQWKWTLKVAESVMIFLWPGTMTAQGKCKPPKPGGRSLTGRYSHGDWIAKSGAY